MTAPVDLYTIPIASRPPHGSWFAAILFPILFNTGLICINFSQFLLLPLLALSPLTAGWTRSLFERGVDWTKECFGRLREFVSRLC
jgi:lysocardiolipin and lysophospholipid acyltransferase